MNISPAVEELFHQLADLDQLRRVRYFEEHRTDPVIRQQVEELLAADQPTESSLQDIVQQQVGAALNTAEELAAGALCGPYRLLRLLGQGGMAEVWLAERTDGLVKRRVALKLPSTGIHAARFAERSHRERDILASLVHPGIARLYDAGLAEGGRPFLALEFVEGANLSAYCDERKLSVRERLRLFLQILSAVQHAHARLVIHRDLKPSNILVTDDGEVKLLDFGIAKLLTRGEAPETELTQAGGRALTLNYASPEQISGQPLTTASDVFSLGVVLFELLTGSRPFVPKRDTQSALEEAILTAEPRRLSQAVDGEAQAQVRSSTIGKLKAVLKGDLDQIVLKAIQKVPERRYSTVDAFRSDIERYLGGHPVLAQPESTWYRTRKFALRHKLPVASAAAVFVALAAGLSVALWQARVARNEARTSAAVEEFTEDIFRANSLENPDPLKARQTTARALLDIGATKVAKNLNDAPAAKLRMLAILASLYRELALDDQAVDLEKQHVAVARALYGLHNAAIVPALIELGAALHASRSVNEREAVLLEAKDLLDKSGDFTSETRASLLFRLAEHYQSTDLKKSLAFAKESVNTYRKRPPSVGLGRALYEAGLASINLGNDAEAEAYLAEAISISIKFDGDPNPDLARCYAFEAEAQGHLMEYGRAEQSLRLAVKAAQTLGGDEDMDTLESESRLGSMLAVTSRMRDGIPYLLKAKDVCLKSRGADDPFYTPQMLLQYGMALQAYGQPEEALAYVTQAVENRRRNRPGTRYLGQMLEDQAQILLDLGRYEKVAQLLAEAAEIKKKVGGKMDANFITPQIGLDLALEKPGEAADLIERHYGPVPDSAPVSLDFLRNLDARAKVALATRDGKTAVAMTGRTLETIDAGHLELYLKSRQASAMLDRGRGYQLEHDPGKALPLLQGALKASNELFDANSPRIAEAEATLGICYLELGDRANATALLSKANANLRTHKDLGEGYRQPTRELVKRLSTHF